MEQGIKLRVQTILNNLDTTREQLLALSDDVWLSIDHNDNDALQQGIQFKKAYNTKFKEFDKLAQDLSVLVQQFTNINLDQQVQETETSSRSAESQRIIKALDSSETHSLSEDFTYKRPYALKLEKKVFTDVVTWKRMYSHVCKYLAQKDISKFKQLPVSPSFVSTRGNSCFSSKPDSLRSPMKIIDGVYAETNYSANHLRDRIKELLQYFRIPLTECTVYLREDRDAEE